MTTKDKTALLLSTFILFFSTVTWVPQDLSTYYWLFPMYLSGVIMSNKLKIYFREEDKEFKERRQQLRDNSKD